MSAPTASPISSLAYGQHAALPYDSDEKQHDTMLAFFRDASERNDRVLYVADPERTDLRLREIAREGFGERMASGAIVLEDPAHTYAFGGTFDPDRMIAHYTQAVRTALEDGYNGLRVAAEMNWAHKEVPGVERLVAYEAELDTIFANQRAIVVCQYDERESTPDHLQACVSAHSIWAEPNPLHESDFLKIERLYGHAGFRVAGEIDMSNHDAFRAALARTLDRHPDAFIDARDVVFANARTLGAVITAGNRLRRGRKLSIRVSPRMHKLLTLLGANAVTGLEIEVA